MFFLLIAMLFGLFLGQFIKVDVDPKAQEFLNQVFESAKTQTPKAIEAVKKAYSTNKPKALKQAA